MTQPNPQIRTHRTILNRWKDALIVAKADKDVRAVKEAEDHIEIHKGHLRRLGCDDV